MFPGVISILGALSSLRVNHFNDLHPFQTANRLEPTDHNTDLCRIQPLVRFNLEFFELPATAFK